MALIRTFFGTVLGLGLVATVILVGDSRLSAANRVPSSTDTNSPLLRELGALTAPFTDSELKASNCIHLGSVIDRVQMLNPLTFTRADIEQNAGTAVRHLFNSRVKLGERMAELYRTGVLQESCARRVRDVLRNLRGIEDYLGAIGYEAALKRSPKTIKIEHSFSPSMPAMDNLRGNRLSVLPAIAPEFPARGSVSGPWFLPATTLVSPEYTTTIDVRSGDVLLSRGNAATSAMIARMGDEDTQFSHMAFVYVNPRDGKAWTIEAHTELGVVTTPLADWIKDGKARSALYRYPDAALAHRAAESMFKRVTEAEAAGARIEYDFPFNMNDHDRLFCSEVVRAGFHSVTDGKLSIPLFPSRLSMQNRDLMDYLDISEVQSFIPADIEIDPRFALVAEWRDFSKMSGLARKDAILTSMFQWMEQDGYRFDSNFVQRAAGSVVRGLRNAGMLKTKFGKTQGKKTVTLAMMLDSVVGGFEEILAPIDAKHVRETGYPMSFYDYRSELERIKQREGSKHSGPFKHLHE